MPEKELWLLVLNLLAGICDAFGARASKDLNEAIEKVKKDGIIR